jgi:hypothetical protein
MKLHDFGLWFKDEDGQWLTTPPQGPWLGIWYDGKCLGYQNDEFRLTTLNAYSHLIKLNTVFPLDVVGRFRIGRPIKLEDFEIIDTY